jgi:hypothetical protein
VGGGVVRPPGAAESKERQNEYFQLSQYFIFRAQQNLYSRDEEKINKY